jgi:hypothetical protein
MRYLNEIAIAVDKRVTMPRRLVRFLEAPAPRGCRADTYEHDRYWLWHCSATDWPTDELPSGHNGAVRVSNPEHGPAKDTMDFLFSLPLHQFAFVRIGEHWGDLEVEGDPIAFGIMPTQTMELPMAPQERLARTA